jgi:hypothetical protein
VPEVHRTLSRQRTPLHPTKVKVCPLSKAPRSLASPCPHSALAGSLRHRRKDNRPCSLFSRDPLCGQGLVLRLGPGLYSPLLVAAQSMRCGSAHPNCSFGCTLLSRNARRDAASCWGATSGPRTGQINPAGVGGGRPRRSPADLDLCLQYRAASWKTLRPLCCWSAAHGRWCCDSETGSRLVFLVGGYGVGGGGLRAGRARRLGPAARLRWGSES